MTAVTYTIPAIHCENCIRTIEMELKELEGVQDAKGNVDSKKVDIVFDEPANETKIKQLLSEINYPAQGLITL